VATTHVLVQTLKRALKAKGYTYRQVAEALDLSEASVKRLLTGADLSVARLDRICQMMAMDVMDLAKMAESESRKLAELSEAQEKELVADEKLLLVAYWAVHGWRLADMLAYFQITEPEAIHCLIRLEKLNFLQLLPGNRIRLTLSPQFTWRAGGPIQQFFAANLQRDFFGGDFSPPDNKFLLLSGMLSKDSKAQLLRRMEALAAEFRDLNQRDMALPLSERFSTTMVVAAREWQPRAFSRVFAKESRRKDSGQDRGEPRARTDKKQAP
jgi:transcriptional regulator with XRE-family HTH domain